MESLFFIASCLSSILNCIHETKQYIYLHALGKGVGKILWQEINNFSKSYFKKIHLYNGNLTQYKITR
jgi:hypothetical protein